MFSFVFSIMEINNTPGCSCLQDVSKTIT